MGISQTPMRASVHSLGEVLTGARFRVPDFQRPYAWTEEHVEELWEDLTEPDMLGGDRGAYHFFGTLLTADPEETSLQGRTPELNILDGQQRLTTFTLLLAAIDTELEEIAMSEDSSARVRAKSQEARGRIADAIYCTPSREQRRLELRSREDAIFANLLRGNPPPGGRGNPSPGERLRDAFRTLRSAVQSFREPSQDAVRDLDDLVSVILDRSIVIHARCVYGFDSFAVFSTLNARGLPLTAAQILRARSLELVHGMGKAVEEQTGATWDNVEKLEEEGDRFLQYYLAMRRGNRTQSKSVVREFERGILRESKKLEQPPQAFARLAIEIRQLAEVFRSLRDGSWPVHAPGVSAWKQRRLRLLVRELGVKQAMPLIMAITYRIPGSLVEVVDVIERAAFVALMCFQNQTRWGDRLFQNANKVFNEEMDLPELRDDLCLFFEHQLRHPERALAENLPIQLRYNGRKKTLLRYFLTTLSDHGYPATAPQQPDEEIEWDLRKIQIDHISPVSLSDGVPRDDKDPLGNLTPLYGRTNAALGNTPFHEKKQRYLDSPLRMTRQLAECEGWTAQAIREREEDMVRFAVALYCRDLRV